jgi:hypothetical protein
MRFDGIYLLGYFEYILLGLELLRLSEGGFSPDLCSSFFNDALLYTPRHLFASSFNF